MNIEGRDWVFFRPDTGRIVMVGSLPAGDAALTARAMDCDLIPGRARLDADYVVDRVVTARPENPARLAGSTLVDLPQPSTIEIDGWPYPCEEPTATLTFDQPGTYRVRVIAWPFLDGEFEVRHGN